MAKAVYTDVLFNISKKLDTRFDTLGIKTGVRL